MSAGTDERGGGRSALEGEIGDVTMNCELGEGGTDPAFESASIAWGTVRPVPRKPAPRAAFASSARSNTPVRPTSARQSSEPNASRTEALLPALAKRTRGGKLAEGRGWSPAR